MCKSLLLESHIGMQIDLSCLRRFMAKPESDHAQIHTTLEQVHGCGVAQSVGCYRLACKRRAGLTCSGGMSGYEALEGIGT